MESIDDTDGVVEDAVEGERLVGRPLSVYESGCGAAALVDDWGRLRRTGFRGAA